MPEELDPIEVEWYQYLADKARKQLQTLAPPGTILHLRLRKDPKYESKIFLDGRGKL